jgi:2-methylcitrate dehydratase PrpD
VLDGHHGFLEAFCRDADPSKLTAGLMHEWETLRICLKAYPCHVTAHTPVQGLRALMTEHRFGGDDIRTLQVMGAPKLLSHHNGRDPADVMQGQYSVPFCIALAAYRDPADPKAWDDTAVADERIRALCRRIELTPFADGTQPDTAWHTRLRVTLGEGRVFDADTRTFPGMPQDPLDDAAVHAKFARLAAGRTPPAIEALLAALP